MVYEAPTRLGYPIWLSWLGFCSLIAGTVVRVLVTASRKENSITFFSCVDASQYRKKQCSNLSNGVVACCLGFSVASVLGVVVVSECRRGVLLANVPYSEG